MKNLNKAVSLIVGVLILSACGSQSTSTTTAGTTAANNTGVATATPTPTGNINNEPNATEEYIQLSGNNGGAFSKVLNFQTSRTLRVKVEALSAPNLTINGYTNWQFPYGCMAVSITVNGVTRSSGTISVGGITDSTCPNAPSSAIIDFSDITTGNGAIQITYSNAQYDNCRYYNNMAFGNGCPLIAVWQNHQVAFNTTVQVDGYYMQ